MPSGNASGSTEARKLKVRENRLRRMAHRQGLELTKSPRRDPLSLTFGTYMLTRPGADAPVFADTTTGHLFGKTLDEVEAYLTGEREDDAT